jgi:hypothetical protein
VDPFVVNGPFAGCLTQQTSTKKGAPSKKNEETPKRKVDGTSKKEENKTKQPSNSDQNPSNLHDICSLFALFMADAEKNPAQADSMAVHKMCVFNAKLTGTVFSVDELIPYQKVATMLRDSPSSVSTAEQARTVYARTSKSLIGKALLRYI